MFFSAVKHVNSVITNSGREKTYDSVGRYDNFKSRTTVSLAHTSAGEDENTWLRRRELKSSSDVESFG